MRFCDFRSSNSGVRAGKLRGEKQASEAASQAAFDMFEAFGFKRLKPGQYLWRDVPESAGPERVVVSLRDQLAFLYRGDTLVAASTISTGKDEKPTPTGIFSVLEKRPFYRSKKYDNAPMPWMQRIDEYGIALHGGLQPRLPGFARVHPASGRLRQEALHRHRRRHAGVHWRLRGRDQWP